MLDRLLDSSWADDKIIINKILHSRRAIVTEATYKGHSISLLSDVSISI